MCVCVCVVKSNWTSLPLDVCISRYSVIAERLSARLVIAASGLGRVRVRGFESLATAAGRRRRGDG